MPQQKHKLNFTLIGRLSKISTVHQRLFGLVVIIGAVCGLAAVLFDLTIRFMERHLVDTMAHLSGWKQILYTLSVPTLGALIAGLLLYYIVPDARGSGIPQVKVAYEITGGRIPLKVVIGKFFIGALSIGTGSSLGREGPTVHICSGIASVLGRALPISSKQLANLLTVGSAAGIAAAFNAPIAGITFTLEELVGNFSERIHLGSLVLASVIAAVVERSILGAHPVFNVPPYGLNNSKELIFYAVLGVLGGLVSVAFSQGLLRLRNVFQHSPIPVWASPAIGGFVVGLTALILLRLDGVGGIAGIGYSTLSSILDARIGLRILMLLLVGKLVATIFCYASGGSGGIFSPVLFIGGALGGVVGYFYTLFLHGDPMVPGAFALVGMSAVFAGVIRAPITAILIIFEMTGSYSIILPLMIAGIISYLIASHYQPTPIYEALLEQDNIHMPKDTHPAAGLLTRLTVADSMSAPAVGLQSDLSALEALTQATKFGFQYFPVIDDEKQMVGILSVNSLKKVCADGRGDMNILEIAAKPIVHLHPDHSLERAVFKMGEARLQSLPVVNRLNTHEAIGMLAMSDIVRAQMLELEKEKGPPSFRESVGKS